MRIIVLVVCFILNSVFCFADSIPSWHDIYAKSPKFAQGWKFIVIHDSATASGNAASFHRYHTQQNYGGLAYHFVINNGYGKPDGEIEEGFRWQRQLIGTHVSVNSWYYNIYGIGICLVGDFNKTKPTAKQMKSLINLTVKLIKQYNIPLSNIIGHNQVQLNEITWNESELNVTFISNKFEPTSCPGKNFPWTYFKQQLEKELKTSP